MPRVISLVVMVTLVACKKEPSATPANEAPRPPQAQPAPPVAPPPPAGTILPRTARLRSAHAGDRTTSYTWKAVYEVDPADPSVAKRLESETAQGLTLDPGDIGAALYLDEVRAAGIADTNYGTGFSYSIAGGLVVIVRPDDDFHRGDPNGYTISIGPAGG